MRGPGPTAHGQAMRSLVLEALLDLPLGTSFREIAARVGKHASTLDFHINKLRKTGHVQVVKRGYHKRRTVVPMRAKLSETEAEWLKLGFVTARAIVVVARADGRYVTAQEVSKALRWHTGVAGYHLGRAVKAGILESLSHKGYRLARGSVGREIAGLSEATWKALRHLAQHGGAITRAELGEAMGWGLDMTRYHVKCAMRAGLLRLTGEGRASRYALTANARAINWSKSTLTPA